MNFTTWYDCLERYHIKKQMNIILPSKKYYYTVKAFKMFIIQLLLLSLTPVASQLDRLYCSTDIPNAALQKFINGIIESKIAEAVEENNVNIFAKMHRQSLWISSLESKLHQ